MRHKELFKTYVWLVETIFRHGPLTLDEIGERWLDSSISGGQQLPRTSFNRYRTDIEDVFGIKINCNRSDGWRYYINRYSDMEANSVQNWMANTISLNNIISESKSVHDRILLEAIPTEGGNLQKVVEAMKLSREVEIGYLKYHSSESRLYTLQPYCVKLYHRRWYLLARYPDTKEFRLFAFDRINNVTIGKKRFKVDPRFNAREYFADCFGVAVTASEQVERVVLRAFGTQRFYMRDLPVHPSQRLLGEGEGYTDYEVTLRPSDDFIAHLLSCGSWIQVISPQRVADKVAGYARSILNRYEAADNQ